jgi:predicted aconitase
MYLNREQEAILSGSEGPASAKMLKLLVALGEVFDAERLVEVESAHISGVSYKNLGEAGLEWLTEQADLGAKAKIRATLNPAGMDIDKWKKMGVPEEFADGQLRVLETFKRMNVELTCTCTPYLIGNKPNIGAQVAWAESSAVCYVNSVLGARTNRESGPTTLASSVTGLAAFYGYRKDENRLPGSIVNLVQKPQSTMEYSAIGYIIGKKLGTTVPYIRGLGKPDTESMKALGAAAATSGGIALWHGEDVTPEASVMSDYLEGLEKLSIGRADITEAMEILSKPLDDPIIMLGCPHATLHEIRKISKRVKGHSVVGKLWVFTSRGVYLEAKRLGYVKAIEEAGGMVYRDTCMVVAPIKDMGWTQIATNSFKAAHYMASMGLETRIDSLEKLLEDLH